MKDLQELINNKWEDCEQNKGKYNFNTTFHWCKNEYWKPHGKKSTKLWITQGMGKEWGNSYRENEEISGRKAHNHTEA